MILILVLQFIQTQCICLKKISNPYQLNSTTFEIWFTYQRQIELSRIKIYNEPFLTIQSQENYTVYFSYENNSFTFYNNEFNYTEQFYMLPGSYIIIIINNVQPSIVKFEYEEKQIKFFVCEAEDHRMDGLVQTFVQSKYLFSLQLQEIDNDNLQIKFWIKQIYQQDGLTQIRLYSDFGEFFNYNFKENYVKLSSEDQKYFIQHLVYNHWFFFYLNSYRIKLEKFEIMMIIKSFQKVESRKFQFYANYSFENYLTLIHQNSIISQFTITQKGKIETQTNICEPDCEYCILEKCQNCKNSNKLESSCMCQHRNMISDENGNCQYPANFLVLQEFQNGGVSCQQFGYFYDNVLKECIPCFNDRGFPDAYCLYHEDKIRQKSLSIFQYNQIDKFKCQLGCFECYLKKKVLRCLICDNGLILRNGKCISCNIPNCEYCVISSNNFVCKLCEQFYSLVSINHCVYSNIYQFDQIKLMLQNQYKQNLVVDNCEVNQDQICLYCKENYLLEQGQCQLFSYPVLDYYNSSSFYAEKPYQHLIFQKNNISLGQIELFNRKKIYYEKTIKDRIYFSQQTSKEKFQPNYYNLDLKKLSFCSKYENCFNFITLNIQMIFKKNNLVLLFQEQIYRKLDDILLFVERYDVTFQYIDVYITSNETQKYISGRQFFKILNTTAQNISLNINLNFTLHIDQDVYLTQLKLFSLEGITIKSNIKQFRIQIQSQSIILQNLIIRGPIFFCLERQDNITINNIDFQSPHHILNQMLFYLSGSIVSQIIIQNSKFYNFEQQNHIIFEMFYLNKVYFNLLDCIFSNITLTRSQLIENVNLTSVVILQIQRIQFQQLKFNSSNMLIVISENSQQEFNYVNISQITIESCYFQNSTVFMSDQGVYQIYSMSNIIIKNSYFVDSNLILVQINTQDRFLLQDLSIENTFIESQQFILLANDGDSYIQNITIIDLKGAILNQGCLAQIHSFYLLIKDYSLINNNVERFYLGSNFEINCYDLYILNYQVISNIEQIFEIYNDLKLDTQISCYLENIKYDQLIFVGFNFLNFVSILPDVFSIKNLFIDITLDSIQNQNQLVFEQNILRIKSGKLKTFSSENLQIIIDFTGETHQINHLFIIQGEDIIFKDVFFKILGDSQYQGSMFTFGGQNIVMQDFQFIFDKDIMWKSKDPGQTKFTYNLIEINGTNIILSKILFKTDHLNTNLIKLGQKLERYSKVSINNVRIYKMSSFGMLLFIDDPKLIDLKISNILVRSNFSKAIFQIEQLGDNSYVQIQNVSIVQYFNTQFQMIFIRNGFKLKINNVLYFPFNGMNSLSIIKIISKYIQVQKLLMKNLSHQGLAIHSEFVIFKKITIKESSSSEDLISIIQGQEIDSKIIIIDTIISHIKLGNGSSLININNQKFIVNLILLRILFLSNQVNEGHLINLQLKKQETQTQKKNQIILFNDLSFIQCICLICINLFNDQNEQTKVLIIQNFYQNNTVDILFKSNGFDLIVTKSQFSNSMINQDSQIIQSNNSISVVDSSILLNQGVLHYKKGQQNILVNNSYILSLQDKNSQQLVDSQFIIPQILKLALNNQMNEIRLNIMQQSENFKQLFFSFKDNNMSNSFLYFPSGSQLNGYKILNLKQRQYFDYLNSIYIFGYNEYNNIKLQINKCDLTTDNNNIAMTPNYIDSNTLLSDVVFTANPYLVDQFKLSINCNYDEIQLQLIIDSKLFKCQLGEILYNNQCQQCNIKYNLYSVKKRSQLCKLVDYDKIQNIQVGLIQLKEGYWRPYYSNDQIEQCQSNNCIGGWDVGQESCKQGYTGPLCTECDQNNIRGNGHYSKYRQQCYQCQYEVNYIYNILYILGISLITLTITTRSQYLICQRYQMLICSNKYYQILNKLSIDQISVLIKQIQNYFFYLQFVNIIFDVDLNLGIVVNTVSNPIQVLNPQYDCLISQFNLNQQLSKIIIQIITPICILTIFYIIILVINRYVKFKYFYVFIYTPILQFFIIYQIIICQRQQLISQNSAISHLTYIQISGIKWIYGARQYQYFESSNIHLFAFLSLILFIFAILLPIIVLLILKYRQSRLQNKILFTKIGYLYQEYKISVYYWEFFKMTSKLIFVTFSLLYINSIKVLVSINSFYIFIIKQIILQKKPYYLNNLNNYDAKFHLLFFTTFILFGLLINFEHNSIKKILILLIYISNILYLLSIFKFIWLKLYYNNPILIDKLSKVIVRKEIKSLVQQKSNSLSKFQSAKKQLRSSFKRKNLRSPDRYTPTLKTYLQSNITEKPQEIELIGVINS